MTTLAEIRAAIVAKIGMVPDVGVVHGFERYSKQERDFAALFMWQPPRPPEEPQPAKELRGWFVRRLSRREYEKNATTLRVETGWTIRGFMALQDARASELIMDALVEQLCFAFRVDLTLGGLVENIPATEGEPSGLQLVESAPFMFGGVLCHGVQLSLTTVHYQSTATPPESLGDLLTLHANWELPPRHEAGPALPDDDNSVANDELHYEDH